jgi:hypothetical protein
MVTVWLGAGLILIISTCALTDAGCLTDTPVDRGLFCAMFHLHILVSCLILKPPGSTRVFLGRAFMPVAQQQVRQEIEKEIDQDADRRKQEKRGEQTGMAR